MATTGDEKLWLTSQPGGKLVTFGDMIKMYGSAITPIGAPSGAVSDGYILSNEELKTMLLAITSAYTGTNPWVSNPFVKWHFLTKLFVYDTSSVTSEKASWVKTRNYINYPNAEPTINTLQPIMYIPPVFITIQITNAAGTIDFVANLLLAKVGAKDQNQIGQTVNQISTKGNHYTSGGTFNGGKYQSFRYNAQTLINSYGKVWAWNSSQGRFLPKYIAAFACKKGNSSVGSYSDSNIFNYEPYYETITGSTKYGLKSNSVTVYVTSNPYDSTLPQQTNLGEFQPTLNILNSKTSDIAPWYSILTPTFNVKEQVTIVFNCSSVGAYTYQEPEPEPTGSSFFGLAGIRGLAAKAYRERKAEEEKNKT